MCSLHARGSLVSLQGMSGPSRSGGQSAGTPSELGHAVPLLAQRIAAGAGIHGLDSGLVSHGERDPNDL